MQIIKKVLCFCFTLGEKKITSLFPKVFPNWTFREYILKTLYQWTWLWILSTQNCPTLGSRKVSSFSCFNEQLSEIKKTRQCTQSLVHGVSPHWQPLLLPATVICIHASQSNAYELVFGLLAFSISWRQELALSLPVWTLHSIAGVESHLVDSRSPVWIA